MSSSGSLSEVVTNGTTASFGKGSPGPGAEIKPDLPLPGSHRWDRVIPLDIDSQAFAADSPTAGRSLREIGVVTGAAGAATAVDTGRLTALYRQALPIGTRPSLRRVAEVGGDVAPLLGSGTEGGDHERRRFDADDLLARRAVVNEPDDVGMQQTRIDSYIDKLAATTPTPVEPAATTSTAIVMPAPGIGNSIVTSVVDPDASDTGVPRIALVETWELHSFLGDYGLGRTLQTFSLLPGEKTSISIQTWRTESATREDATSVFDSSDTAAQTRFSNSLTEESGAASQDQGGWAVSVSTSVSAGANFGIVSGSASLSAGFNANHQEASQRFSNSASQAASDHAAQSNNSRRQSVESSSESQTAAGSSTTTTREISNTNLRRVLNFVFRELNQEYETYIVLRDVQVAFYNGRVGSAEVVPVPEVPALLRRHIRPDRLDEVGRAVLSLCARRLDHRGEPRTTLQVGKRSGDGHYEWKPVELDGAGSIVHKGDAMASDVRWRFRPGPLNASKDDLRTVDGLVTTTSSVVLRTDNLIVEALLGQSDALDPYAAALQAVDLRTREAEVRKEETSVRKEQLAVDIVSRIKDPKKQLAAWEQLFGDKPEIQIFPAVAPEQRDA